MRFVLKASLLFKIIIMEELILKNAKFIGRKWGVISTLTGVVIAFFIWVIMTGFSDTVELLREPLLYIGICSGVLFSLIVGGYSGGQIINNKKGCIGKWILYGFLTTYSSVLIPIILTVSNANEFWPAFLFYLFYMTLFGGLPILVFGTLFGTLLKMEIVQMMSNKKEPKN